ncbi:MAG: leucine-rich repeat protein [Clostridiales bacterium]|nr:leucine-rich repeat protein [Clostridiales bacterium]
MKTRTKTSILLALVMAVAVAIALLCTQVKTNKAFADEVDAELSAEFSVSDEIERVDAEYEFIVLNDTECSVRITNCGDVTIALIPDYTEIDGKQYTVTEIDDNGFMSSPNLIRVDLRNTIKRIGYGAFADCAKLKRINLANVQEIDDCAFEECPELAEILIPASVKKIGTYIFRGNNTKVMVRAEAVGEQWSASWNKRNDNQDVEFSSKYKHPMELKTVYDTTARSAQPIGYAIAEGQPRNEDYYDPITEDNYEDKTHKFEESIFIPAEYNGKPIMKIADDAFYDVSFSQLIVEYAQEPLTIGNRAFTNTKGESIVINRPVRFCNDNNVETKNIFSRSSARSIVLPNSVTKLVDSMFAGCSRLSNIFFAEPVNINFSYTDLDSYLDAQNKEDLDVYLQNKVNGDDDLGYEQKVTRLRELCIIKKLTRDCESGVVDIPGSSGVIAIGNNVFQGTTAISELHLYDTIQSVGSTILSGWDNDKQIVYVYIDNNDEDAESNYDNWHTKWQSSFTNVKVIKTYYTVTFDPDGGKFVDSDKATIHKLIKYGNRIGDLPEVEKLGYQFIGWKSEDGTEYKSSTIYQEYKDITLKAKWERIIYTITFDPEGGEGGTKIGYAFMNGPLPDAVAPTKLGSTFRGYYTERNGNGKIYYHYNMDKACIWTHDGDLTLYADWEINAYTVNLHSGYDKNEVLVKIPVTYDQGMPLYLQAPQRLGYTFMGYYDEMNGAGNKYYNADMTSAKEWNKADNGDLYADWKLIDYKINYELNGGTNKGNNPDTFNIENAGILNDATHETLYFDGWICEGEKITSLVGITKDITLTATWTDVKTIRVTKAFSTLTVDVPKASIIMDCAFSDNCNIVFTSKVVTAMISGNGRVYNMSIIISNRDTDFGLVLNHISVVATSSFCAINMSSQQTLYLMTVGVVTIHGYSPTNGHGKAAISCHNLVIGSLANYEHTLTVNGGNGSDGKDGKDGKDGNNGGVAIEAETVIITCDNVTIVGGSGGKGGSSVMTMPDGKKITGTGFKGFGGYGVSPVSGEVYVTENFSHVNLKKGQDGKDGSGQGGLIRPPRPEDLSYTTPVVKPWNPNLPITPPIGGIIPTSNP